MTTPYTPFTGIRVAAGPLFAGYACGLGPGQIYKYAVIVRAGATDGAPASADIVAANVYDCDTDAAFQNLPGSGTYSVQIDAYDAASFPSDLACTVTACAPPTAGTDFGTPTWTTTCTATQEQGDNSLVVCSPLLVAGVGVNMGVGADAATEASVDAAVAGGDAGAFEAGALDAAGLDASVADANDSGADVTEAASPSTDGAGSNPGADADLGD